MAIKSLDDVVKYVNKNKLEKRLNVSFNACSINKPSNTFYSIEKIKKFVDTKSEIDYQNYYVFLSKEFPGYDKFSDYLRDKVRFWKEKNKTHRTVKFDEKITNDDLVIYLLKKFVIDPVNGRLAEIRTMNALKERFPNFKITEPTPEEDSRECFDFKLTNGSITFYFQHKPEKFFTGLKSRTMNSFMKIKNASIKYKKPIFLTKESYRNTIQVYIRNKSNSGMKFVKLQDFSIESLNQEQINGLATKSFERIENLNKPNSNKNKP